MYSQDVFDEVKIGRISSFVNKNGAAKAVGEEKNCRYVMRVSCELRVVVNDGRVVYPQASWQNASHTSPAKLPEQTGMNVYIGASGVAAPEALCISKVSALITRGPNDL